MVADYVTRNIQSRHQLSLHVEVDDLAAGVEHDEREKSNARIAALEAELAATRYGSPMVQNGDSSWQLVEGMAFSAAPEWVPLGK